MPHNPHSEFDQTVLEMIEHSPIGAVPHTPVYQDALTRLRASHQVYPSADHKNGFVSVRSLAHQPSFYAHHLQGFMEGLVEAGELETDAGVFNRYVLSLPAALRDKTEAVRPLLVARKAHHRAHHGEILTDPVHSLFLVPGSGSHHGLPGNYIHGSLQQKTSDARFGAWIIHLHDSQDGSALCEVPTAFDAWARLQDVISSAPFLLSELEALGFRVERS